MIMRKYLLIVVLLSLTVNIMAQSISNKERRTINYKVLELIEEYERTASLSDSEEMDSFSYLFQSMESKIFCDLMGTRQYMEKVSLRDYVKAASANVRDLDITVKDVRKGELFWTSGVWTLPVTFRKTMSYVDKNGVLFSAEEFYEDNDYIITMNVIYDPVSKSCTIGSMDGSLRSDKTFPDKDFFVVSRTESLSERYMILQERLRINGKALEYNSFDQAIVPELMPWSVGDPDVVIDTNLIASTDNYKMVNFSFKPIKNRFKAHVAVAPIMAYKATSDYDDKSMALEAGLDFGTTFVAGNAKCGIYIGAALSMSNIALMRETPSLSYGKVTYFDERSGYYVSGNLKYRNLIEKASLKFKDVVVPLYFETEHRLGNTVLLTWNFGAKAYLPLSTEIGSYGFAGERQIGNQNKWYSIDVMNGFMNPTTIECEPFSVSAMANIGVDINISKNRLFATVKAGYEHGLTKVLSTTACPVHSESDSVPMLFNKNSELFCHSPLSGMTLQRQAVWFELGIKVKM